MQTKNRLTSYNPNNPEMVSSFMFRVFKDLTENYLKTAMIHLMYSDVYGNFDGDLNLVSTLQRIDSNPKVTTRFCCESHPEQENPIHKGYLVFVVSDEDKDQKVFLDLIKRLTTLRTKDPEIFRYDIEFDKPWLCLFKDDFQWLVRSKRYDEDEIAVLSSYRVMSPTNIYPAITFRFRTVDVAQKQHTLKQLFEVFEGF